MPLRSGQGTEAADAKKIVIIHGDPIEMARQAEHRQTGEKRAKSVPTICSLCIVGGIVLLIIVWYYATMERTRALESSEAVS